MILFTQNSMWKVRFFFQDDGNPSYLDVRTNDRIQHIKWSFLGFGLGRPRWFFGLRERIPQTFRGYPSEKNPKNHQFNHELIERYEIKVVSNGFICKARVSKNGEV